MADVITEIEEEEYTSQLTAPVFKRIVKLVVVLFVVDIDEDFPPQHHR